MYLLRRAAARAVSHQPLRTYTSLQSRSTRFAVAKLAKPSSIRQFHQTWIWRAEQEEKKSPAEEEGAETATVEPSEQELREDIKEESIAAPDVADAAKQSSSVGDALSGVAQKARDAYDSASSGLADRRPARFENAQGNSPSRILYIGNLFFEVTAPALQAEFARFGTVTNCRIVTDDRGMSRGFGYVEFANQEDADLAVREQDQRTFEGRRMAVQYHQRRGPRRQTQNPDRPMNSPSRTLFVGNMSYQMSDKDLNDLFREVKDVIDVRVAIDRRSGQPRGFAHADFVDVAAAERAKEFLEQKVIYGRQLRIDFSADAKKAARGDYE